MAKAKEETAKVKVILDNKEAQQRVEELTSKFNELRKAKRDALKSGDTAGAAAMEPEIKRLQKEINQYKKSIVDVDHVLRNLNKVPLKDLNDAQKKLSRDLKFLNQDSKEYKQTLEKLNIVQRQVSKANTQIKNSATGLGASLKNMLPLASFTALLYCIRMLIVPFTQFQWTMAKVGSVSNATREEFGKLKKEAQDLGASTEYTASQVADLQLAYARLGFTADQILTITSATLDLATATGSDLASSADVAGSTLRAFGYDASQMLRVVDVRADSFNKSALDLATFTESMKYVAPVAATANVSLEQTTAMLGVLANRGIRGSMAGTALKRILTEISIEGKSVAEALDDLNKKGLTLENAEDEVGKYAMTALTVLASNSAAIETLNSALIESAGTAARTAAVMRDNIKGDLDTFKSKLEGIAIWLGDTLNPLIRGTIQFFTMLLTPIKIVGLALGTYFIVLKTGMGLHKSLGFLYVYINNQRAKSIILINGETTANTKQMLSLRGATAATQLYAAAKLLLAGNFKAASVAAKMFMASIGPLGWISIGLGVVVGALAAFSGKADEAASASSRLALELSMEDATYKELTRAVAENAVGSKARAEAIRLINERYGELLPNMVTEKMSNEEISSTLEIVNRKMEENISLKIKAAELEKIRKEQMATETDVLDRFVKEYEKLNSNKTPEQLGVFTMKMAELISKAREGEVTMNDARTVLVELGYDAKKVASIMAGSDSSAARGMRNTYSMLLEVSAAAKLASNSMSVLNSLISGSTEPVAKYADYTLEKLEVSLRNVNGQLSTNVMITRSGRLELEQQRDALTKELVARKLQTDQFNTYANTIKRLKSEKEALELQRGAVDVSDKKEIARIGQLIEAKEKQIAAFEGKATKNTKQWSVSGDEAFLKSQTALREQLLSGTIATDDEYNKLLLGLEIKTLEERIASKKESGAELAKLQSELAEKLYNQSKSEQARLQKLLDAKAESGSETEKENASYEKRLRDLELFNRRREEMTTQEQEALDSIERLHAQKLSSIYVTELSREIDQRQKALNRTATTLKQSQNDELEGVKTFEQKKQLLRRWFSDAELLRVKTDKEADKLIKAEYDREAQEALRDDLTQMLTIYETVASEAAATGLFETGVAATEEDIQKLNQIIDDLRKQLSELGASPMPTLGGEKEQKFDVLGMSSDRWTELITNIEDGTIGLGGMLEIARAIGEAFTAVGQLMSEMENREFKNYTATQNKKKQSLERQLKSNTLSQERYNDAVQRIDAETEAKREELEIKQAKRNKVLAILSAIINTAIGVTTALTLPPPASYILAGITAAMGAIQIATIAATPLPGREDGGILVEREQDGRQFRAGYDPDKRGYINKPTVIVGESGEEFVVNDKGVHNPTIRPVIDILNRAQKNKTIGSINLPAVLSSAGIVPGRASGGAISQNGAASNVSQSVTNQSDDSSSVQLATTLSRVTQVLDRLNYRLDNPLPSEVSLLGKKGLHEAEKRYKRIQDRSGI